MATCQSSITLVITCYDTKGMGIDQSPQTPHCINPISHDAPYCDRNVHIAVTNCTMQNTGLVLNGVCATGLLYRHESEQARNYLKYQTGPKLLMIYVRFLNDFRSFCRTQHTWNPLKTWKSSSLIVACPLSWVWQKLLTTTLAPFQSHFVSVNNKIILGKNFNSLVPGIWGHFV